MRTRRDDLIPVPFGVEMWSLYAMSLLGTPPPRSKAKKPPAAAR